jgi:tetratricopeptide (TPR) repeat protein
MLAFVNAMDYWLGSTKSPRESIEKAVELAQKALALDETRALTHGLLSHIYSIRREYDKAIAEGERAVALDPSGADVHSYYAQSLTYAGRPEEAIPVFQKAIRLNPLAPTSYFYSFGQALLTTGKF